MPTAEEIATNQERLYESSSLRDDLNDDEATILLKWGETQIERIAQDFPDEFEQKARFLRQVIKNINRFVGQRQFNELEGQQKYMSKVNMYLPQLGWEDITEEQLFAVLPQDKADMASNLQAILNLLSPGDDTVSSEPAPEPESSFASEISENQAQSLETSDENIITQEASDNSAGIEEWYDEEE